MFFHLFRTYLLFTVNQLSDKQFFYVSNHHYWFHSWMHVFDHWYIDQKKPLILLLLLHILYVLFINKLKVETRFQRLFFELNFSVLFLAVHSYAVLLLISASFIFDLIVCADRVRINWFWYFPLVWLQIICGWYTCWIYWFALRSGFRKAMERVLIEW